MDCPRALFLGLTLAVCTVTGCVTTQSMPHQANTYVAYGDMQLTTAFANETPTDAQKESREVARMSYLEAIKTDPKYLPAYVALARLYRACDDHVAAQNAFQQALQLNDKNAGLWYELGMTQCKLRQWEPAQVSLNKAISFDPQNRQYASSLGFTLVMAGKVPEGFAALAKLNGEAKAHQAISRMLTHMKQPQQAQWHMAQAALLDPNMSEQAPPAPAPSIMQTVYTSPSSTPGDAPKIYQGGVRQAENQEQSTEKGIDVPPPPKISIRSR